MSWKKNVQLDPKTRGSQENLVVLLWKKWRQGGLFFIYCWKCVTVEDNHVSTTSENTVSATIIAHRLRGGACKKQTVAKDKLFLMLLCNVLHFGWKKKNSDTRAKWGFAAAACWTIGSTWLTLRWCGKDRWQRAAPECVVVLQTCFSCGGHVITKEKHITKEMKIRLYTRCVDVCCYSPVSADCCFGKSFLKGTSGWNVQNK